MALGIFENHKVYALILCGLLIFCIAHIALHGRFWYPFRSLSPRARMAVWLIMSLVIAALGTLSRIDLRTPFTPSQQVAHIQTQITRLPKARALSNFKVQTHDSRHVTKELFEGQWNLLFFGFSACPSLCPSTMRKMETIHAKLDFQTTNLIFVTVNPSRDTAEQLARFLRQTPIKWIGLSGHLEEINQIARSFGAYIEPNEMMKNGHIAHSGSVFVINPQGEYVGIISDLTDLDSISRELNHLQGGTAG